MKSNYKKILQIAGLTFLFLLTDQITKYLIVKYKVFFDIIPGYFSIHEQFNTGAAFSMPIPSIILVIVTTVLIFVSGYLGVKNLNFKKWATMIVASMFLSGAIGNLIDRIRLGAVVDFIDIWFYPVFNLADLFLTVSIFYILLFYGKIKRS